MAARLSVDDAKGVERDHRDQERDAMTGARGKKVGDRFRGPLGHCAHFTNGMATAVFYLFLQLQPCDFTAAATTTH